MAPRRMALHVVFYVMRIWQAGIVPIYTVDNFS